MKKEKDLLHGCIWKQLVWFALPIACSSILQQLFNSVDVAVVGRFAGATALAAVGANGPVINLLVNLFSGLAVGTNAVLAKYIGENNREKISRAIHTSIVTAVVSGLLLLVVGNVLASSILVWLSTPAEVLPGATLYFRIYFLGMPFVMLYNFASAILRAKGDTKRPMIALVAAGILNVIFNLIFVIVFGMGVAGVALATCISNMVCSLVCLYFLSREENEFHFSLKSCRIDGSILSSISRIGLPAGLQGVVFSLSNVILQSSINQCGAVYVAGVTAAVNYEYIAWFLCNAFNAAALTFISQNYAAQNFARCRSIIKWSLLLSYASCFVVCGMFILTRHWTIWLFTDNAEVARIAQIRMLILMSFELLNCTIEVLSGIMRGFGKSATPALIATAGICGVRLVLISFIPASPDSFVTLMMVYPISWVVTVIALVIAWKIMEPGLFHTRTRHRLAFHAS